MKKFMFCAVIAVIFVSCMQKVGLFETSSTPVEKWEVMEEYMMAPRLFRQ